MLKLNDVTKIYQTASKEKVTALSNVSLSIDKSGIVFIVGQSGSGKTTLLNLIGGLDMPEQGEILVEEHVLGGDIPLEKYRQNYVGFVFQEYNLLENLSVYENIAIAVSSCTKRELNEKIVKVLKEVDLSGYENRKMNELSGGQKQRVAIARALAKNTSILLCDEPTGNLDSHTSKEIFDLLKKISLEKTIIVVSHNEELAKEYADRLIRIADGKIISDQQYVSEITVNDSSNKTVNNVPFRHKLKLGFKNLFTQKFKTLIASLLLLLSLVTLCTMQICLNYNSERNLAKSLSGEKTLVVLQNNSTSGISNVSERYPIKANLSKYVPENKFYDGYRTIYGTVFICNNAEISKDFYVKQDLGKNEAYISDYFVDIIIKLNDDYRDLVYTNYEDLLGQEVVYQNIVLFKIAGILKTDYKEFLDERGNQKENKITAFLPTSLGSTTIKLNSVVINGITFNNGTDFLNVSSKTVNNLFAGGSGTNSSPYTINCYRHLNNIRKSTSSSVYYKLTQSINLNGYIWTPIQSFSGTINGNYHTLYNMKVLVTTDGGDYGFVKYLYGTIQNLNFSDVKIQTSNLSAADTVMYIGAVAGCCGTSGKVLNCDVSGSSTYDVRLFKAYLGGIVGLNNGYVYDSDNYGSQMNVSGYAGGIVGVNRGNVEYSHASNVTINYYWNTANGRVGGIVGHNAETGTISRCYSSGMFNWDSTSNNRDILPSLGLVVGHNQGVYSDCSTNMGYNISYYYWHFIGWYDQSDRCFKVDEGKVGYQE